MVNFAIQLEMQKFIYQLIDIPSLVSLDYFT